MNYERVYNQTDDFTTRFWANVDTSGDCWIWTGRIQNGGYGYFRAEGKRWLAHRASWVIHNGPVPSHDSHHGMCVLHVCDTPACTRPDHLFLGTQQQNIIDMRKKGRGTQPSNIGEAHPAAKLTESDVITLREQYARGGRFEWMAAARKHGVSKRAIVKAVTGLTWKHI